MNLVLIHGRDQQGKDKDELKELWVNTLKIGLSKSNLTMPDVSVILPFYGDLLDQLSRGLDKPKDGVVAKGPADQELLAFEAEMYTELAKNAKISNEEILSLSPNITERGPGNWGWVQAIMRALDNHTGMGDISIRKFTHDVYCYLKYEGVRSKVNALIMEQLLPGPTVVVGHSLGSVVGYNILHECQLDVRDYITVGSPLGLKSVSKQLPKPLRRPQCIKGSWYNAYDDGDYVALNPLDDNYFNITPAIINSSHVNNQTDNQHGIEGYLNDSKVAERIFKALTRTP